MRVALLWISLVLFVICFLPTVAISFRIWNPKNVVTIYFFTTVGTVIAYLIGPLNVFNLK